MTDGAKNISGADFAVVLHVFHADVLGEMLEALGRIGHNFDLFVTTPLDRSHPALASIRAFCPSVDIRVYENRGRDVGPFVSLLSELQGYPVCCKLHTKKGQTGYGDMWLKVCLESLLACPEQVHQLLEAFKTDPRLLLAGPEMMYKSGPALMLGNEKRILQFLRQLDITTPMPRKWGFFAGTMFWFKPQLMRPLLDRDWYTDFTKEKGSTDGELEHAFERIFGLLATLAKGRIALLRTASQGGGMRIVDAPGKPDDRWPSETARIYQKTGKPPSRGLVSIASRLANRLSRGRWRGIAP